MNSADITFTQHAVEQMFERHISVADVLAVLEGGEVIQRQAGEGGRLPRRLMLGWRDGQPLHVVCADAPTGEVLIVTTYVPNPALWDVEFRRRIR